MSRDDEPSGASLVGEDPRPHEREWRVERVGWVVMALVVLLGLLGFWGSGVLSTVTTTSADGRLSVSYERFVRTIGQTSIVVHADRGSARGGTLQLSVDQPCLASYQVQSMQPEPTVTTAVGDRLVFEFPAGADSELTLRLDVRPSDTTGLQECSFGVGTSPQVRTWHWVHP